MTKSLNRVRVALNRPEGAPELVLFALVVVRKMTDNPWFPQPTPSLAAVEAATAKLGTAQAVSLSLARGTKDARDDAMRRLVVLLNRLKAYVQGVADDNPEAAATIIEGAGMSVVRRSSIEKPPFAIRRGRTSGSANLTLKAAAKIATYVIEMSADGGKTWVEVARTLSAKAPVSDLEPGRTYLFRYAVLTRRGLTDWSAPVAYLAT